MPPIRTRDRLGVEAAGAVGIGGASDGHLDARCARAGIARVRDGPRWREAAQPAAIAGTRAGAATARAGTGMPTGATSGRAGATA